MSTTENIGVRLPEALRHQSGCGINRNFGDVVERQVHRWLVAQKSQERLGGSLVAGGAMGIERFLAISREAGAGGSQIARLVGNAIGWDVLDREILEFVAERYHTSLEMLEHVDETTTSWIAESLGHIILPGTVSQMQYVHRVSRVILAAAQAGKVIFVGRGAQFLLPRKHGLRVRIIAPREYRVKQIMERGHASFEKASDYVTKTDAGRQDYARRYFGHDIADPLLYDLVINVEHIGHHRAARSIADILTSCFDLESHTKHGKE